MTRYFYGAAHEQFGPGELLAQAIAAEQAGFDGIACSDHFQPWWEPGESGHAWVWLGAAAQATTRVPIGTGVTAPVHRYHPAIVAQAFATLEAMFPGRAFLGIGSGESLNESPIGMEWPDPDEQVERMEEALEVINALFDGERVDHDGRFFATRNAYLHTRPERRVPIYVSAFAPEAAKVAGRLGDGLWTLADPEAAPELIETYRDAAGSAGREPGEVLLHVGFSWAEDADDALERSRVWKAAAVDEFFTDDWHDPRKMNEHAESTVEDDEYRESFIVSADLDEHLERIREIEKLDPTTIVLMNVSGADPQAAIDAYGENVLPALRGGERVAA
jgi:coenzyme F420-dependent glucose-6-phosphate dehydrogenase